MTDFLDRLAAELKRDEGVKLKPYVDTVGKLTIGVGRNLTDVGISQEEADYLLRNDIAEAQTLLDRGIQWWRTLDEERQLVLLNMAFNLGPGLFGFTNTLAAVQNHEWEAAALAMSHSKWAEQVGLRADRLIERMRTGQPLVVKT